MEEMGKSVTQAGDVGYRPWIADEPDRHQQGTLCGAISLLRGTRPCRIVLLDDEEEVREAMKGILSECFEDYEVVECAGGNECWLEISSRTPDLLITDLTHPGMRLAEMLSRLLSLRASFPILVVSAFVEGFSALREHLLSFPGIKVEFLGKPYLLTDFRAMVLKCHNLASPSKPEENPTP